MKLLLVVNPSASSVTARARVVIQKALSADHDLTVAETSRRGHAVRLARGAASDGTEVVVVLGGDGTLNEAANGLAGTDTALAPLPGGSTNVFARTIGLPDSPVEATGALLDSLQHGRIEPIGLGSVNGRYFLFHAGLGYDAAVVEQVERRGGLKRYAGHPLFVYSAVDTWMRHYDRRRPAFSVHYSDGHEVDDAYFAIVCNTNPYTYLGSRPLDIAPEATLDRPLAVVVIRSLRLTRILRLAGAAFRHGGAGLRKNRAVDYRFDVETLSVVGHRAFPYQVDGDFLGYVERLQFEHHPGAIRLVTPT